MGQNLDAGAVPPRQIKSGGKPCSGNPRRAQRSGSPWERSRKGADEGWPTGRPEGSGLCGDEGGGTDVLKLDDALAKVDDLVAEKLGL